MIRRISFTVLAFYLSVAGLLAQADPEPVSSPQRGTTYANDAEVWYAQPFIWIGALILVLVVVLLMLRKKQGATNMPHHRNTN